MTVTGINDDAWLIYGLVPGNQIFPEYQGALMLAPPFSDLIYLGQVPFLARIFELGPAPELPLGFEVVDVQVQVVMKVFQNEWNLINSDHIVILDSSF